MSCSSDCPCKDSWSLRRVGCRVEILPRIWSCQAWQRSGRRKQKLWQRQGQEEGCVWIGQHVPW